MHTSRNFFVAVLVLLGLVTGLVVSAAVATHRAHAASEVITEARRVVALAVADIEPSKLNERTQRGTAWATLHRYHWAESVGSHAVPHADMSRAARQLGLWGVEFSDELASAQSVASRGQGLMFTDPAALALSLIHI